MFVESTASFEVYLEELGYAGLMSSWSLSFLQTVNWNSEDTVRYWDTDNDDEKEKEKKEEEDWKKHSPDQKGD